MLYKMGCSRDLPPGAMRTESQARAVLRTASVYIKHMTQATQKLQEKVKDKLPAVFSSTEGLFHKKREHCDAGVLSFTYIPQT